MAEILIARCVRGAAIERGYQRFSGWGDLNSQLTNGFPTEFAWRSGHFGASLATTGIVDNFRVRVNFVGVTGSQPTGLAEVVVGGT